MAHPEREETRCDLCGRPVVVEEDLVWHSRSRQWLCPECLREEESCGCEQ